MKLSSMPARDHSKKHVFVPSRKHTKPKNRLITRKTTIRPFHFTVDGKNRLSGKREQEYDSASVIRPTSEAENAAALWTARSAKHSSADENSSILKNTTNIDNFSPVAHKRNLRETDVGNTLHERSFSRQLSQSTSSEQAKRQRLLSNKTVKVCVQRVEEQFSPLQKDLSCFVSSEIETLQLQNQLRSSYIKHKIRKPGKISVNVLALPLVSESGHSINSGTSRVVQQKLLPDSSRDFVSRSKTPRHSSASELSRSTRNAPKSLRLESISNHLISLPSNDISDEDGHSASSNRSRLPLGTSVQIHDERMPINQKDPFEAKMPSKPSDDSGQDVSSIFVQSKHHKSPQRPSKKTTPQKNAISNTQQAPRSIRQEEILHTNSDIAMTGNRRALSSSRSFCDDINDLHLFGGNSSSPKLVSQTGKQSSVNNTTTEKLFTQDHNLVTSRSPPRSSRSSRSKGFAPSSSVDRRHSLSNQSITSKKSKLDSSSRDYSQHDVDTEDSDSNHSVNARKKKMVGGTHGPNKQQHPADHDDDVIKLRIWCNENKKRRKKDVVELDFVLLALNKIKKKFSERLGADDHKVVDAFFRLLTQEITSLIPSVIKHRTECNKFSKVSRKFRKIRKCYYEEYEKYSVLLNRCDELLARQNGLKT